VYGWRGRDSKHVQRQGSVRVSAPRCHGLRLGSCLHTHA
jgi:hypothetical protein